MALEANIAAASLVVALTALVVALGQLFQALISTAEGYRRCAPSVIGAWARLRHRKWNWTEFRFEVEYATPHLTVLSSNLIDWDTARHIYGPTYDLLSLSAPKPERNEKILEALKATIGFPGFTEAWKQQNVPRYEVRVTWFELVRDIHRTYGRYWPRPGLGLTAACTLRQWDWEKADSPESGRTHAAVAVRRWNWDFMPSDLLKPLATSTLNNIILFALRLNMQWRVLDQKSGNYQADGNGYALTSTVIRGLGTTFTFEKLGEHNIDRKYAPSEAVDKMLFGIIPGCIKLVKRDFPIVDSNRNLDFKSLFAAIGINNHELEEHMATVYNFEQRIDAVILLSAFLPVDGSPVLHNCFPGWQHEQVQSTFHFFEGRMAYMELLQERLQNLTTHAARSTLEGVLKTFNFLSQAWKNDLYNHFEYSAIEGSDNEKKILLVKACREIFDWTTEFFRGNPVAEQHHGEMSEKQVDWSEYHEGKTRYVDLVAGHTIMAWAVTEHVLRNWDEYSKEYPGGEKRRKEHSELIYWRSDPGFDHKYAYVREYVASFNGEKNEVIKHLRSKGVDWHEDYIEAAWWVLVLRGIVWDMSTTGNGPRRGLSYWQDNFVPSTFYDIRTPVWIT